MGTIINGNKWAGACVNGKVVSGLAKNGVVFYKKQLIDLYKRRVMVGDNLRNKVVYGDFKMGYYVTLMNADEEDLITCNNNRLDTVYEYITSDYCSVDNNMRDSSSNLSLYEYDATNGTEILNNNSLIKNDKDYIVSEIIDNATYRHLFIEDPNIRPIQIGDNLSGATLYFVIPDNVDWFNVVEETEMYECISTDSMGYFAVFPQDGSGDGMIIYNSIDSGGVFVRFNGAIEHNISKLTLDNDFGTIISIDGGNSCPNLNQYILVDITTLGT